MRLGHCERDLQLCRRVGLLVALAPRWTDLVVLWQCDNTRHYYAGCQLYDRLGAPGGLLTAAISVARLGAICASGNGNAKVALRCGVVALVTVAASCLALMVVGPRGSSVGRGHIGIEPKLELGAALAVVSASLALAGGLLARCEHRLGTTWRSSTAPGSLGGCGAS